MTIAMALLTAKTIVSKLVTRTRSIATKTVSETRVMRFARLLRPVLQVSTQILFQTPWAVHHQRIQMMMTAMALSIRQIIAHW